MLNQTYIGECRALMQQWVQEGVQVQMCVTSPPYFGLRNYGHDAQIGLEGSLDDYIANLVEVFDLVKQLLHQQGTLWLVIGDSYAGSVKGTAGNLGKKYDERCMTGTVASGCVPNGCKPKDLIGVPWKLAFALRDAGWYLRQDIIWHKPNAMPESMDDRCTKSHEYLFLLSKSKRYYFDADAIREPAVGNVSGNKSHKHVQFFANENVRMGTKAGAQYASRNKRSVWQVPTRPYRKAHFAVFPERLIGPCILAGSRPRDVVLDPFMGSGTTARVCNALNRDWLGCELNPAYAALQLDIQMVRRLQI